MYSTLNTCCAARQTWEGMTVSRLLLLGVMVSIATPRAEETAGGCYIQLFPPADFIFEDEPPEVRLLLEGCVAGFILIRLELSSHGFERVDTAYEYVLGPGEDQSAATDAGFGYSQLPLQSSSPSIGRFEP